jgi:DNA-binding CsgD family transcriptional regulator
MNRIAISDDRRVAIRRGLFLVAAGLQIFCGIVFVSDVVAELDAFDSHTLIEALGAMGLAVGVALTLREYRQLLRRNHRIERELGAATGAFQQIVDQQFAAWDLTEAERDVALLSIKGVPISQIARMRNTRDGTVKAQSAAIYRKAGLSGRAELVSVFVEELIAGLRLPKDTGGAKES